MTDDITAPLGFTVAERIDRPLHDVYEAVADPRQLEQHFVTGGAQGRLETGARVTWDFHDDPGAFPLDVVSAVPDTAITLRWHTENGVHTTVEMTFTPGGDDATIVRITESGWPADAASLKESYGNCAGWAGMLTALKAWLEHGARVRLGAESAGS